MQRIYSGETFDMEFITADEKRGTGGELIQVIDWQIPGRQGKDPASGSTAAETPITRHTRCPNHDDHGTLNIHHPETNQIRKIHISLIQSFNGKRILNG